MQRNNVGQPARSVRPLGVEEGRLCPIPRGFPAIYRHWIGRSMTGLPPTRPWPSWTERRNPPPVAVVLLINLNPCSRIGP